MKIWLILSSRNLYEATVLFQKICRCGKQWRQGQLLDSKYEVPPHYPSLLLQLSPLPEIQINSACPPFHTFRSAALMNERWDPIRTAALLQGSSHPQRKHTISKMWMQPLTSVKRSEDLIGSSSSMSSFGPTAVRSNDDHVFHKLQLCQHSSDRLINLKQMN